jgi:cold shock CspA family protein
MAKSSITFSKKEKEKKRLKKRQDKAEKMEERRANAEKGLQLEDMMVYVDENGNLSSTPPDPKKKKVFTKDDITIGVARREEIEEDLGPRSGKVTFFNESKGYGFIRDAKSGESIFFHQKGTLGQVSEGDTVSFETEDTPKGPGAKQVKKI